MADHGTGRGASLTASRLGMDGPRGPVYRGVTFRAGPGDLVALAGPPGSGRTSLLLTLTGRMKPTAGTAETDGLALPKRAAAVRRFAALGPMAGVNDLDPALTVREHLRERNMLRRPGRRAAGSALAAAGLDLSALERGDRTRAGDLSALDAYRLGLAAALLGAPRLLAADDVGDRLPAADRAAAWQLLRALADTGTTVLAACADADDATGYADLTVPLAAAESPSPALDPADATSPTTAPEPAHVRD